MEDTVISVENISKQYRFGSIGQTTLAGDFQSWWSRLRGKDDPNTPVDAVHHSRGDNAPSDRFWALRDVSFEVRRGEVLGVIGRNGAGKSTLLKILSRVTTPTNGSVGIKGRVASLLEVGTGFHPELTGRENIFLNGAILGMSRAEIARKFDDIAAFSEVDMFMDTPVKRYSSGMYVRLAFAVAAHLDPEILIVDEVLAVGDIAFQKKCLGKMDDVSRSGRTILFVSHNMAAVQNLCGRAILLDKGRITADGASDAVVETYAAGMIKRDACELEARPDRSGNGKLRFTGIAVKDRKDKPVDAIISGQDVAVELTYVSENSSGSVSVSLGFYNSKGEFLFFCGNELSGSRLEVSGQEGLFRCVIPRLPLPSGHYFINIFCELNGNIADWVQQALSIDVIDGDFYGSGKLPPPSHKGVLVAHSWESGVL